MNFNLAKERYRSLAKSLGVPKIAVQYLLESSLSKKGVQDYHHTH